MKPRHSADRFLLYKDVKDPHKYDCIFVEGVSSDAIEASQDEHRNLMIRTTGVEVYEGAINRVIWENVAVLFTLSQHQIDYFKRRWESVGCTPRGYGILPVAVISKMFTLRKPVLNKEVALVANITGRKGIDQIPEFLRRHKEYKVHHLGKVCAYGSPAMEFVRWAVERDGNANRYLHQGIRPFAQMDRWYQGKSHLWLPSLQESFSRAILEGMACGLKPIIRYWAGAEKIWPNEFLYNDVSEIGKILELPYEPEKYRAYVEDKFNLESIVDKFEEFI